MDIRYMWNYNMIKDFKAQHISSHWFVNLIQGFVDYLCPKDGLELVLIARRRWLMGGTRYKARGLDHDGNAANHTEIEQLVYQHQAHTEPQLYQDKPNTQVLATTKVYSHVQVRGSIPIFWDQTGLTTVVITQPDSVTGTSLLKHYSGLQEDYMGGSVVILNLIARNKGLEKILYERQEMIMLDTNLLRSNEYDYYHFDFHKQCHENSEPMMNYLKNLVLPAHMEQIGLFVQRNDIVQEVSPDGAGTTKKLYQDIERLQNGVIRTNCVDCLDRTNVAQ